ncbi:succinate dehydrogenase [Hoeflea sp. YIM 152468]|uniref:succinate dehydrogenase n=1 Tax=Hoeflea sp. YIM 152468 TaxID=3031759 RepID=UPI0023DC288D|nr:succinate dehydrogenase [Hoeflea sp. YIM 152468]MDF1609824.1 succinate dehydrogenase [Hoeflea sp. YIM 152468]
MLDLRLYMAQRLSAMVMIPLTLGHIAVMIYAIQDGLSAAEILGRTQGSVIWFVFYAVFVLAVSLHASIGLRVIVHETLGLKGLALEVFMWLTGLLLLGTGLRAVLAVTL